jgi:hypothetical protein
MQPGRRFGRLVLVEQTKRRCTCICDCGQRTIVDSGNLTSGNTRSCGCLRHEHPGAKPKHGHGHRTPTYSSWQSMLDRCTNPNHVYFRLYGGRGITVCDRWRSFENFLADMGLRPEGRSLDRVDPDGIYEPTNCRWATAVEQRRNRRDR